jgi:predicted adenine nucleotide alpha hydrolase (AANH) superfamily ATPase
LKVLLEGEESLSVLLWYYNPNIHPKSEYLRRRDALAYLALVMTKKLSPDKGELILDLDAPYDAGLFLKTAAEAETREERCRSCYALRLKAAAKEAKLRGFKEFSSTLLFSKEQNHEHIRLEGEKAAKESGMIFRYMDFRPGRKEAFLISKALDIYRQNYCGCVYGQAGL